MSIEIEVVAAGPPGPKGNTGSQGPKGDKGDTGNTGAKGDKGDTGSTGAKGDTGSTGAKGDKGDTGDKGDPSGVFIAEEPPSDPLVPPTGAPYMWVDSDDTTPFQVNPPSGVISVLAYGAVGDGVTDDTAAIQAAINAAAAADETVYFPHLGGNIYSGPWYKTTATITVPGNVDVLMDGPICYKGVGGEAAISVNPSATTVINRRYRLRVIRSPQSDWTSETDIGIVIRNVASSHIEVSALQFTLGVQFFADAGGIVHNHITLVDIVSNKVGVDLVSDNSGWVNENQFYGGHFSVYSSTHLSLTRYGIRLRSLDGYRQNNNIFHKPSFEIGGYNLTDGAEAVGVLCENAVLNRFVDVRDESAGGVLLRATGSSAQNYISSAYGTSTSSVDDSGTLYPTTKFEPLLHQHHRSERTLFNIPDVHRRAVEYSSDYGWKNVPGLMWTSTGAPSMYGAGTITADYLQTSHAIGVYVDTRQVKRFVVDIGGAEGYNGRLLVRAYNSSGVVLEESDYDGPLIQGAEGQGFYYTSEWGKGYINGADRNFGRPVYFVVCHDDVDHVGVFACGGTEVLRLRSFAIRTPEVVGQAGVWTPFPENAVQPMAVEVPQTGTYTKGKVIFNATPSSGVPLGWVCITGGTPGTWLPIANVGPETAVTAALGAELGDGTGTTQALTGLTVGAFYHVAAIGGTLTGATIDGAAKVCYYSTTSFKATATSHTVVKTSGTTTAISVKQVIARSNGIASLSAGVRQLQQQAGMQVGSVISRYLTTGDYNTGIGVGVLGEAVTASDNTGVGTHVLSALVSGAGNTAVGQAAGQNLTSGSTNVAIGSTAMASATTSDAYVAIGKDALYQASSASYGVAIGAGAHYSMISGSSNVGIGWSAGSNLTTGNGNVALGGSAGRAFTTGSYNTAIGNQAGYLGTTAALSGTVIIGADSSGVSAQATADNQFVLGTSLHNVLVAGSLELTGSGTGVIVRSPDGTRYRIGAANGGTVSIAAA